MTTKRTEEGTVKPDTELRVMRRKLEMIEAIVDSGTINLTNVVIRRILDSRYADFEQPCEDCRGPLIRGDGIHCEWCSAKIPKSADLRPERYEARLGGDWCKRREF